jgi:hypothetical protein
MGDPMHEPTTLHFDLGHLEPDQPFTLHAGRHRYALQRHTRMSLARARNGNHALRLSEDHAVTHYAEPAQLPSSSPLLLRVTAPRRNPDDLLDRLVLTSIYLPRRHRVDALARRKQHLRDAPLALPPQLAAAGGGLPPDDVLIDIGDMNTALDAAASLVFHHGELLTLQADQAAYIINNIILYASGLNALASSILDQSQAREADPKAKPNWISSQPGTNWTTGQADPAHPIYLWSDATLEYLGLPLRDALRQAKDDPELEHQCWSVLPGITRVPMSIAPPRAASATAMAEYAVKEVTPQSGVSHTFTYDAASSTATVSLGNTFLRWLQISVDQYEPGNKKVGNTTYLGMLSPPDTIMAVPIPTEPTDFPFTFDEKASRAVVTYGGLGQSPFDWSYDQYGITCTTLFNLAIPLAFIALGVAVDQGGGEWSDLTKQVVPVVIAVVEAAAEGPLASMVAGAPDLPSVMNALANLAGALLLNAVAGSDALAAYLTAAAGESAAEDAEPFVGWAALAIGAAADTASIVETTVAVASSPASMALDIERTMDVAVEVHADPQHTGQWPATAEQYMISVTYDDGPVYAYDAAFDPKNTPNPIVHTFAGLPAGGNVTVLASFYSDTGWLAGRGQSGSLPALPSQDGRLDVPKFAIKENLVPLSATTDYTFLAKLSYGQSGRVWVEPPSATVPTATVTDLNGSNVGDNLGALGQITLNDHLASLGYSWQASGQGMPLAGTGNDPYTGQEFTFQAIGEGAAPQSGLKVCEAGYIAQPCLAFPPPTMANPVADGFLLEPDVTGAMYLRALSLQPGTPIIALPGQSLGRFTGAQDDLAVHPAGYAVALCVATCKLQVARLTELTADASAPTAAVLAGQGTRPGLLQYPVAVACGLDTIVVLQTTDADLQGCLAAFDVKGNPVGCFAGGASSVALRPEGSATVTVVDLSLESKGYLYVLKYLTPPSGVVQAADYRLDIYNPDGSFLVQVAGIAAARLHVDLWRNVFTLNYEILPGSGRTEPSVSEWVPSTPDAIAKNRGGHRA